MAKLESVYAYLFDIFEKESARTLIEKLNQELGTGKEDKSTITTLGEISRTEERRNVWSVAEMRKVLDKSEQTCKNAGLGGNFSLMREAVQRIDFLVIDNEDLPYSLLVMCVEIDTTKINLDNAFQDIYTAIHPLRAYFDYFEGINTKLFSFRPNCPYFLYLGLESSKDEIDTIYQICTKLLPLQTTVDRSGLETFIQQSAQIRNIKPLSTLHFDFSLLSVVSMYSNVIAVAGNFYPITLGDLMNPVLVVFSQDMQVLQRIQGYHRISPAMPRYDMMIYPDSAASSFMYLVSTAIWLIHTRTKAKHIETQFVELRKSVQSSIQDSKDPSHYVIQLNKVGTLLAELTANVGTFKRSVESKIAEFVEGRTPFMTEIPILPAKLSLLPLWSTNFKDSTNGAYLQTFAKDIQTKFNELQMLLSQYSSENEKLNNHLTNLVNLKIQNAMKRYGKSSVILGVSIAGLTGVLIWLTVQLVILTSKLVH